MFPSRARDWLSILLKLGVIASCVTGILQHDVTLSGGFMNSIYKAFTMQSNIGVAAMCFMFLVYDLLARRAPPRGLYVLKFMFTTSVLLTWFVFAVLLTPLMPAAYLVSSSNLFLHNLTPVLALLDFILTPEKSEVLSAPAQASEVYPLWSVLVMPLLYLVFFFSAYAITGELPVPYFFLDYQTLGWFSIGPLGLGVAYWIGLLLLALLALGGLARELKSRARAKPLLVSLAVLGLMIGLPLASALISLS